MVAELTAELGRHPLRQPEVTLEAVGEQEDECSTLRQVSVANPLKFRPQISRVRSKTQLKEKPVVKILPAFFLKRSQMFNFYSNISHFSQLPAFKLLESVIQGTNVLRILPKNLG
jgi:hypothetical protein